MPGRKTKLIASAIVATALLSSTASAKALANKFADSLLVPTITLNDSSEKLASNKKAALKIEAQFREGWLEASKKLSPYVGVHKMADTIVAKPLSPKKYQTELEIDAWVWSYPVYQQGKPSVRVLLDFNKNMVALKYVEGLAPSESEVKKIAAFIYLELAFENKRAPVAATFFTPEDLSLLYSSLFGEKNERPMTKGELLAAFTSFLVDKNDPCKLLSVLYEGKSLPSIIDSKLSAQSFKSIMDAKSSGADELSALLIELEKNGVLGETLKGIGVSLGQFGVQVPPSLKDK